MQVQVTLRSTETTIPCEVTGEAPDADCPLAVVPSCTFDHIKRKWMYSQAKWKIAHRPTGFVVGKLTFATQGEAMETLMRCRPEFAAWRTANGERGDVATMACRGILRMMEINTRTAGY